LGIFLGRNALPIESFNASEAQELLAGKLLRQARRPDGDVCLAPRDFQHPILAAFRGRAGTIPWEAFPVFRYWELGQMAKGANMILPYSDGHPAVVERVVGRGRAITMTTPISDRASRNPWNLLPAMESWPFMILAHQMAAYLVASNDQQLNYLAGQTAVVPLDPAAQRRGYMLFAPGQPGVPLPADLNRPELTITPTDRVGNYQLQAGGTGGVNLGFSVNYATEQTRLDRLSDQELSGVFGLQKYHLARTREQIERDVSTTRVGRELFPPLILIIALVLGLEMLVANRFYKE
jgi:hypothetical protein